MSAPVTLDRFFTPAHKALWAQADDFAAQEIQPKAEDMEYEPTHVDRNVVRLLAGRGWFGVTIPKAFGGMEAGQVAKTILIHRVACVSGTAAAVLQASLIPVAALLRYGTTDQHTDLLPRVARGTTLMSIAVTEPQYGGHIGGMKTRAEWDGSAWILTGAKAHVGNSHLADLHVVVARTDSPDAHTCTSKALTAFLVRAQERGVQLRRPRPKLGLRGFSYGEIAFDRVRVAPADVLGAVGQGFDVAQFSSVVYGRPNLTAVSLGLHETAVALTTKFVSNRPRYHGKLADIGVVRDRLGHMAARLTAARLLAYHAVDMLDHGLACDEELFAAKGLGHDLAHESGTDAMQLYGAAGLEAEQSIERFWRDMQTTYAPAGTGEIQRLRLAGNLLQEKAGGNIRVQWSELHASLAARPGLDPPVPA